MNVTHIGAEAFSYPLLFLQKDTFEIWRDPADVATRCWVARRGRTSVMTGLLVSREGQSYRVIGVEETSLSEANYIQGHERRVNYRGVTFVCEGTASILSVDDLRQRIAWIVSARGHFESAEGFELPYGVASASSVSDLFDTLTRRNFRV